MKLTRLGLMAGVFATSVIIGGAGAALAATVSSGFSNYGPVNGISYANRSDVTNNSVMGAYGSIKSTNGKTIPGGWSSVRPTLYKNGAVCLAGSDYYYPNATTSWSGGLIVKDCGSGSYTSRAVTGAYNGSGYNYYYAATSPALNR